MSTKAFRDLNDYSRHGCAALVSCRGCGHYAILDPIELTLRMKSAQFATAGRRFKCSRCGSKGASIRPRER